MLPHWAWNLKMWLSSMPCENHQSWTMCSAKKFEAGPCSIYVGLVWKMGKPQIHWDLSMLKWLELGGLVQHSPSIFSQTYIIPVLSHEIPMKIDSQWAPGDLPGKGLLRSPGTAYLPSNLHLGCRLAHFHGDILWCFYWQSNEDILGIPNGYDIIVYIYI